MGKVTALPVGQGDAFLWRREDGKTVLVDGGRRARQALYELSSRKVKEIDVMVCTHGDADHTDGLVAVLNAPDIKVHELWVPSRWGNGLHQVASSPTRVLEQLVRECKELDTDVDDLELLEVEHDHPDGEIAVGVVEEAIAAAPDSSSPTRSVFPYVSLAPGLFFVGGLGPVPSKSVSMAMQALEVAARIWAVVRTAIHAGVPIRWFKYGDAPAGGEPGWLEPVNSAEVFQVRRAGSLVKWLALTLKNKEALVWKGLEADHPPVLFASDSDFRFDTSAIPNEPMLVTAPHHGAKSNKRVYGVVRKTSDHQHHWMRSDTPSKSRPCEEYTNLPIETRACTACNRCVRGLSEAVAVTTAEGWSFTTATCVR